MKQTTQSCRTLCLQLRCSQWMKCFYVAILATACTLVFIALTAVHSHSQDITSLDVKLLGRSFLGRRGEGLAPADIQPMGLSSSDVPHGQRKNASSWIKYLFNRHGLTGNHSVNGSSPLKEPPRIVLPDDCFHGLLQSVDPTCDLGRWCTRAWREEDVLCHVFLHQAGLKPAPGQCLLDTETRDYSDHGERGQGRHDIVPRIAYYVLVSDTCGAPFNLQFLHYVSMLSAKRYLKPGALYVFGNCVPIGYWWSRVLSDIDNVRFVYRPRPQITPDGQVQWTAHLSDVIRLQVLLVNGGVYLDTDMILLRPLDPLLRHPLTMGLVDIHTGMGNALILAAKGSVFLRDWYAGYKHFDPTNFHENGMWTALRMWQRDPDSVHMESKHFYSPNWFEAEKLFESTGYDMSQSYAVHVWHRHAAVPTNPGQILALNTTLGEILRQVYFGR